MNSTDELVIPSCANNSWSPIVIIVISGLNILISLGKQFLNSKKQDDIKNVLSKLNMIKPIETEQVQLNIPDHLKASVTKET